MNDFKIGSAEARFADLIWAHEPVTSGEMARVPLFPATWTSGVSWAV